MRSLYRTLGPDLTRSIALVCLADALVGASFGAIAVSGGFPLWTPMLLSVVVFAGAAQFLFVGLVAAGGSRSPPSRPACWSTPGTCLSASPSATSSKNKTDLYAVHQPPWAA